MLFFLMENDKHKIVCDIHTLGKENIGYAYMTAICGHLNI